MRALGGAFFAALVACSALSAAFCEGSSRPSASGGSSEIARALLDEARQASGVGDWETAAACLGEAASQDPVDSDILYLKALAAVKRDESFASPLADLDAALASGRFADYARLDASLLKAELLVRERRWKEALDALGRPDARMAAEPGYRLLRARAFSGLGDTRAFVAEIGEGLRRFPEDSAFARLFLSRAGSVPASEQARATGELILGRLRLYAAADAELGVLAAPLMPDLPSQRDAVLAYRATGGKSAASTLRALEYGVIDETAAAAELLSGSFPISQGDLASLLALSGSPAGMSAVASALSAWTGTVLVDSDGDGVFEGSFALERGRPTSWSLDSRQDGIVDAKASFAEGLPGEIRLTRGDLEIDVKYSSYPAVASVSFVGAGERRSYAFGPEAFSFALLALRPFAGSGASAVYFPYPSKVADPSELSCAMSALSVEKASGDRREVTLLEKGVPLSATVYKGDRVYSLRSYENGRPVLERIDADGDGRFETEQGFAQDAQGAWKVAWSRTDADGDGVYEYREEEVFPFVKEWDYDGNGSVDARQSQLADGSLRKEFSSRLDGRLDEEVVVKDGKIRSLSRNGKRIDLVPDSNPKLTWIGSKPFDLGTGLPPGEGIFSAMGKRYKLIRLGELAFAELIP